VLFFEYIGNDTEDVAGGPGIALEPSPVAPGETVEDVLLAPFVNRGVDNAFNNISADPQETINNVQRIDYIVPGGIAVPAENRGTDGFVVFERGGNDNFRIAAIISLGVGNIPATYGPLISAGGNAGSGRWGTATEVSIRTMVTRREAPTDPFRLSHIVNPQPVRGIFFPVSSLLPDNQPNIFGYSLFANDNFFGNDPLNPPDLTDIVNFPGTTLDNDRGGLDLVASGFGFFRAQTPIQSASDLALLKRITNLFGPTPLPNFAQVVGNGTALNRLRANGLGQGLDVIADPQVQAGNGIEYTVYFANSGSGAAPNVVLCDQIPVGLTFDPNGFAPGLGIQAIAASSPPGPVVNYTNAADGDPGTFFAPGAALPPFCGTNQGNGAVVVNAANVAANQVGFIRFRTTVD
jgi:uncharacterized repeat protein (TIGR01451 family)